MMPDGCCASILESDPKKPASRQLSRVLQIPASHIRVISQQMVPSGTPGGAAGTHSSPQPVGVIGGLVVPQLQPTAESNTHAPSAPTSSARSSEVSRDRPVVGTVADRNVRAWGARSFRRRAMKRHACAQQSVQRSRERIGHKSHD